MSAHLNPSGCLTSQVPALLLEVVLVQRLPEQDQRLHMPAVLSLLSPARILTLACKQHLAYQ